MTQIIGGHNLGLFDGSFTILNRNDQTGRGTMGHGVNSLANISNGNLIFQEHDIFLPSFGQDFDFVRTYNSRGEVPDSKNWTFMFNVKVEKHDDTLPNGTKATNYSVTYGDGTQLEFVLFNAAANLWRSTDGAGAYETLQVLPKTATVDVRYLVTRADRTQYLFDNNFKLLSITDANGVATTFTYSGEDVVKIQDDTGHLLTLAYQQHRLLSVSDETGVLTQYAYTNNLLTSVTDRMGHVTKYHYNADKLLDSITLPDTQKVGNQTVTYATRTVSFTYTKVKWDDQPHHETPFDGADEWVLASITDANGGMTTFEYNFVFAEGMAANDRDLAFRANGGKDLQGGTTRVVDALGNARAYSNAAEYKAWRVARGYYETYVSNYDPKTQQALINAQNAQAESIRAPQAVTYTYDPNGQIIKVKDELGFETNYAYDVNGNLTSVTDANGYAAVTSDSAYYRKLRFELGYNDGSGNGRLVANLTSAEKTAILDKFSSRFTYDGNGNLLTSRDNAGNTTIYTYTSSNQVEAITTAMGHTTSFVYDGHQNLILRTDALGNKVSFEYDTAGNLIKKVIHLDKNDLNNADKQQVYTYGYDAFGNNTSVTTRLSATKTIVTNRTFDHFGNVLTSTDGRGGQTIFAYDLDNRLLSTIDPEGHSTTFAYDSVGNAIAVTDAGSHTISRFFDANNMLLWTSDPSATATLTRKTQHSYDILGNETQSTDAEGRVTTYAFDAHRQLVDITSAQVKAADGVTNVSYHETFAYDGTSNAISTTDRNGNTMQYMFTVNGQLRRITDAVGNVTEYLYNAELRQTLITVGAQLSDLTKRRLLSFDYDNEGRLITETDGIGNVRSYSYDSPGNILSVTDGNGRTANFEFDLANRLIREMRPGRDPVTNNRYAITYEYDDNGNRITTTDERGKITRVSYDRDNRAVLVEDANGVKTVYTYDSRDNRTSISIGVLAHMDGNNHVVTDSPNGAHATNFAYDEFNQLISKTDGLGFTESYTYDRVGNQLTMTDRLTRVTTTQYDALNRAVLVTEAQGTAVQRTTTNRYDGDDNLVKSITGNRETSAVYDGMNRVIEDKDARGTVTRYVLDSFGNVVTRYDGNNLGVALRRTTSFEYDARGRMSRMTDAAGTVTTFGYDLNDHLTTRTTGVGILNVTPRVETFEYNDDGRLSAQVNGAGNRTEFTYDGVGNRTSIIVRATNSGSAAVLRANYFEYDDVNRLSAERDGNNVRTEYRYDTWGNKIEVIQAKNLGAQERHTLMFYDADERLTSVVDPIGWARAYSNATEFQGWRSAHGYTGNLTTGTPLTPAQITQILDTQRTSYGYDQIGNQTTITEADGTVTANTFDELGRLVTNIVGTGLSLSAYPHGGVKTVNTYDVFGNVLTSTRSWADGTDARTTTYTYDALDQQLSVTDGEGFKTAFEYDVFGNQTRITRGMYAGTDTAKQALASARNYDTALAYDAMDRLLTTTDARGNRVSNTYDAFGNRATQTSGQSVSGGLDAAHASTLTFKYDGAGRMIERDSPTGGVVKITYDAAGNQLTVNTLQSGTVDTVSAVWTTQTLVYDGNGRIISSTDSYGTRTDYNYDAVGNRTSVVFAANVTDDTDATNDYLKRTTAAEYDLDNNQIAKIDALLNRTTFAYDAVGNLVKRTDALNGVMENGVAHNGVTRFYYDAFGRQAAQLDARNYLTTFTYDSAGNVTQARSWMLAISGTVSDGSSAPTPTSTANDRTTSSQYDLANRLTRQEASDASYKTFAYDATDKLLTQTQYAAPGNTRTPANTTPRVMTWQYDNTGRLAGFTNVDGTTETYAYDAANNKISQTIHNGNPLIAPLASGGRTDPDRTTTFTYDGDNRLLTQTFDSTNLNIQQTLGYDLAGNVVSKIDARGKVITTTYDLENRVLRVYEARGAVSDPLGNYIGFTYDALGNNTAVRDARGNTTTFTYDKNNRVTQETRPEVNVRQWTLSGSAWSQSTTDTPVNPTIITSYDAVGNVRQITDARGFVTTSWYDAMGNKVAERNGDGGVRTFTYDGLGEVLTVTLDMTAHVETVALNTLPAILGTTRVITNTYDLGGRITRTQYSSIDVTTLDSTTTPGAPTSSKTAVTPYELNYYDGFGNKVESVDRNGNHSYAWYDKKNRQIATLDAGGYLIETDYDDQDHVVQQRKYKTKVTSTNSPFTGERAATKPTAPDSSPAKIDRIYDAAGRLIEEWSPAIHAIVGGTVGDYRVVTRFTYDANGNMTSKALNYATIVASTGARTETATGQRVEYYWYDNANRRVALVGADRVLNTFTYDANGNVTAQRRYWNTVGSGVTLSTATLSDIAVTANNDRDEETTFVYDKANKLITQIDRMNMTGVAEANDDLTVQSRYDESGNLTYRMDPDGNISKNRYNAAGLIVETVSPNGSDSFLQYDTSGLKVRAWTGGVSGGQAPVATNMGASVGNGTNAPLIISWDQTEANVTSWVAWDTVQHNGNTLPSSAPGVAGGTGGYANATSAQGVGTGLSAQIILAAGDTTVYFRIMTSDAAGNITWSEEKSVYVPPRIQSLSIAPGSGSNFVLTVTFDATIASTSLKRGGTTFNGTHGSGNTYTFTFTGSTTDDFHIEWVKNVNGSNVTYSTTDVKLLQGAGAHVDGGNGWVNWPLPGDGTSVVGDGQYMFLNGRLVADKAYIGASTISRLTRTNGTQFNFQAVNTAAGQLTVAAGSTAVYDVLYGNLNGSTHSASISWTQVQHATVSNVQHTTSPDNTTWDVTWANSTGVQTNVTATLNAASGGENNFFTGNVHFDYRLAATGLGQFSAGTTVAHNGSGVYSAPPLSLEPGNDYDIKIWYTYNNPNNTNDPLNGKDVIVEFRRVTVPPAATPPATENHSQAGNITPTAPADSTVHLGTAQNYSGDRSITVLAQETGGSIQRSSGNGDTLTVTAGTYIGPINPGTSITSLTPATTANAAIGHQSSQGGFIDQTYFTEIEYNALGIKIGTNEDTGLWRRFGVDANGNVVKTDVYGTQVAETAYNGGAGDATMRPSTTFKTYDERNLETGSWGATVVGGVRGVTRTTYDYAQHKLTVLDPGNTTSTQARTFTYDDVGNLIGKTDALGNSTSTVYNVYGQWLTVADPKRTRTRTYNESGLVTDESINGVNDHVFYAYDAFGRRTQTSRGTTGVGNATTVSMDYDQRDRLVTLYDAVNGLSNAVHYYYDGRDNRIWTQDAMNRWFGSAYDSMGQLTHQYSFTTRWVSSNGTPHTDGVAPTTLAQAQEAVTSSGSIYRPALHDEATTYDLFGNKTITTDAAGHHQFFSYGAFGRLVSVSGDSIGLIQLISSGWLNLGLSTKALVTNYTYNRFGYRTRETSNYDKSISYTYDDAGQVTSIDDSGVAAGTGNEAKRTKTTFTYDVAGRVSSELLQKGTLADITAGSANATVRNYTYAYNANGWMTSWSDSKTSIGEAFTYDGVGNVASVTGKISGNNAYFVHTYTYDNANRVTGIASSGNSTTSTSYTYDNRGRRATWVYGTATVTYTYDNADRVTQAAMVDTGDTSKNRTLKWTYDRNGNITSVRENSTPNGAATEVTITTDSNGGVTGVANRGAGKNYTYYTYDANNVSWFSESSNSTDDHADGYNQSTTNMDRSGRVTQTLVHDGGANKSYTYTHYYNADGTEARVGAGGSGDVTGNQISTYDVNRQLVRLDLGKGDGMESNEFKDFEYDNLGQIFRFTHDDGQDDHDLVTTDYLYANGNPAGEYTGTATTTPTLDSGNYSVLQNVPGAYGESSPPEFPTTAVAEHLVAPGETLQSIAGAIYGHPELWFVIADANGLTGSEQLSAGMRLVIPNSVQYGGFSTDTHTIYNEGDIVGSKLPNLKSPPPPSNKCAIIAAIILIVVVAILAIALTVVTVGAAAPAAAAAIGGTAGVVAGVIAGAVIGAAIAFTASVITQGILIGFKLQEGFDWKAVAADTAAGAFSGAAAGLGAIVRTVQTATTLIRIADVVAQTALQVAGEITRQVIISGHVDDWTGVALAGVGGALGAFGAAAERDRKVADKVVQIESKIGKLAAIEKTAETTLEKVSAAVTKFTSWVKTAAKESRLGKLATRAANAVGDFADATADYVKTSRLGKAVARAATYVQESLPGRFVGKTVDVLGGNTGKVAKLEEAVNSVNASVAYAARNYAAFAAKQGTNIALEAAEDIASSALLKEVVIKAALYGSIAYNVSRTFTGTTSGRTSASTFGAGGSTGVLTGLGNLTAATARSVINTLDVTAEADRRRKNTMAPTPQPDIIGKDEFIDRDAAVTFGDRHQRRHGWLITNWVDAAGDAASQIVSAFGIDRFADLGTIIGSNRMLTGETAHFLSSSIAAFAAGTVGHVGTNPIPLPIFLANATAPNARG